MKSTKLESLLPILTIAGFAIAVTNQEITVCGDDFHPGIALGFLLAEAVVFLLVSLALRKKEPAVSRGIRVWTGAFLAAGLLQMAGRCLPERSSWGLWTAFAVSLALPLVLLGVNLLMLHLDKKTWDDRSVADTQAFLLQNRQQDQAPRLRQALETARRQAMIWAVCLLLAGTGIAMLSGLLLGGEILCYLYGSAVLAGVFVRLHLPRKESLPQDHQLDRAEYPALYDLAERAQRALGCKGRIRILVCPDCNAGLWPEEGGVCLILGGLLLGMASEEELYAVLLHEFGHAAADTPEERARRRYQENVLNASSGNLADCMEFLFYSSFDSRYALSSQLLQMAVSLQQEYQADQAMVRCGKPEAAASVLLKLACHNLYDWEMLPVPMVYRDETAPQQPLTEELDFFRQTLRQRIGDWKALAEHEIQGRGDTHPTLRARLDAMGIGEPQLYDGPSAPAYQEEQRKVLACLDAEISKNIAKDYEESRRDCYLEPLEKINQWQAQGEPLDSETYTDLMEALAQLERYEEEEALCDRAIAALPIMSSHDAYYVKGCLLLHRYDPRGLDYLYQAIEANSNHIDEGLDEIGHFCCMTGRREELETYRARAMELGQQQKDLYSRMNDLKNGTLLEEHLPEPLHRGLLACLREADGGHLDKVYLVRNQITEDFFASAVILRFRDKTEEKVQKEIYHRVFRFLDNTTDWQFTLIVYHHMDHPEGLHLEKLPGSCIYEGNEEKQ